MGHPTSVPHNCQTQAIVGHRPTKFGRSKVWWFNLVKTRAAGFTVGLLRTCGFGGHRNHTMRCAHHVNYALCCVSCLADQQEGQTVLPQLEMEKAFVR